MALIATRVEIYPGALVTRLEPINVGGGRL
jgi:hypothetical protein